MTALKARSSSKSLLYELKFGDLRYKRLSGISVSHIYNLREKPAYRFKALTVSRTKSVQVAIGKRGKPNPDGKPGHLRVDTVHQGDLNGVKGVYHINMVDEVTQWQIVVCVEAISEAWLEDVLEAAILMFPFLIRGFHSDNGGEFINKQVAGMLLFGYTCKKVPSTFCLWYLFAGAFCQKMRPPGGLR